MGIQVSVAVDSGSFSLWAKSLSAFEIFLCSDEVKELETKEDSEKSILKSPQHLKLLEGTLAVQNHIGKNAL